MQYENLTQTFAQSTCNTPAIIFGLGREGWSTYQFLRHELPELEIFLLDDQPITALAEHWQVAAQQPLTTFKLATDVLAHTLPADATIFKTPGIPPSHPLSTQLTETKYRLSSNTQLLLDFILFINSQSATNEQIKTIGVTGTKGKSTTSSLIAAALSQSKFTPLLGGNIGKPPLELIPQLANVPADKLPVVVLELSSHQLADMSLSPNIAIIQNITPEHLDYYPTVWHYVAAKAGIVRSQQAGDSIITCTEFELPHVLASISVGTEHTYQVSNEQTKSTAQIIPTELRTLIPQLPATLPSTPSPTVQIQNDTLVIHNQAFGSMTALLAELQLFGAHNMYNVLAAVTTALILAVEPQQILTGLRTFKPLAHRLQLIAEKNGVRYINDSLATTPEASAAAIASFSDSPVILIAGGHDRHLDFAPLVDALMLHRVKGLVLFPPTGEQISETLHKRHPGSLLSETQFKVQSMPEAVQVAARLAKSGDVVLLSPASASFGTFKDYQDRGEQFAAAVQQL